jgi:hypothetical protein
VPEAEGLVESFRIAHDPAAAAGMPAHITILYPFKPSAQVDARTIDGLRSCFQKFVPIDFSLVKAKRFSGVLYLAPDPDDPFRALTLAVWEDYPEFPPYEGKHPDIIPHLSVASDTDEEGLRRITDNFGSKAQCSLPCLAKATEVALMDNELGSWRVVTTFRLGGAN